ncbi:MAG: hypothetical protein ACRDS9_02845 [Pseudonocardiaceae bacterium]
MNGQVELASFMESSAVDETTERSLPEGVFHLISAHEVVPNWHLDPVYVALCGEVVETSSLAETDCPNECECEFSENMAYCPACLREAIRQNRRAGVDVDCPTGVIVRV